MALNLSSEKTRARLQAKNIRAQAHNGGAGAELVGRFPAAKFRHANIVGGFWPIQTEIDIMPLLRALSQMGHTLALPCTPRPGKALTFRHWVYGEVLKKGPHNTQEPYGHKEKLFPDLILVPLLAFTGIGERLGYGGGYYDRTLAALDGGKPVFACGVAYAAQEATMLPTGSHDKRLDGVLTENYYKDFA